ncbi:MAG: DUF11 domain-containing protein, partial [Pseudomonadota bacterium]
MSQTRKTSTHRTRLLQGALLSGMSVLLHACNSDELPTDDGLSIGAAQEALHVAIRVEAENFTEGNERWYVTDADNDADVDPDPDPPHFSTAGGNSYMELLPDTRVTHDDPLNSGENYWGDSNGGPSLKYRIDIPEAGRYLVYTKAYSTGTEDNGIHVGLNNTKPESGKRIQFCSGKNKWTWSSSQRVPENHCGVKRTIYLDVPAPGTHEIVFYAREDGFEIDQFILLKEAEDGSQICEPFGFGHKIQCKDAVTGDVIGQFDLPVTETHDGNVVTPPTTTVTNVDLDIDIDADENSVSVGDEFSYSIEVNNNDNDDSATSVEIEISLPDEISFVASSSCAVNGSKVECNFNEIPANDSANASFTATATEQGNHRVDAQVTADQNDNTMGNNADSASVDATPAMPAYAASLSLIAGTNVAGVDSNTSHVLVVKNIGLEPLADAQLRFDSDTLAVTTGVADCSVDGCLLEAINPDASVSVPVSV